MGLSREGFYDIDLISAHPGGDPAKFQKFFRRRRRLGPKMGVKFWMFSKKWTHRGLRWLRIGPKSKVIVNLEYVFFILGPEGPTYTNLFQKPQY